MIKRTTDPSYPRWADWGGRGITVCERWRSFPNFLADMGEKPPGTTLDRLDNDGNYELSNCRWATPREQNLNKRAMKLTQAKIFEIEDLFAETDSISEIARRTGIERHRVGVVVMTIEALMQKWYNIPTFRAALARWSASRSNNDPVTYDH